jgi:O-acetyl-ADP-ribose deacetylase (regulator of RNase III)
MPLRAWQGDITTLDLDAIVNAANEHLLPGGGVCGAIHRAAGPELWEACRPLAPVRTGRAVITPGFRLKARHVIHAVGPVWHGGGAGEAELLAACYRASLARLREAGLRSIAFPAISTGIYGYPANQAVHVAVETVIDDLDEHGDADVTFACFDRATYDLYRTELGDTP